MVRPAVTSRFTGFVDIPSASEALRYKLTKEDYEIPIPSPENVKRIGAWSPENFTMTGARLARVVKAIFEYEHLPLTSTTKILDWGCGSGRVTIPMSRLLKARIYGCDVDKSGVAFLNANVPEVRGHVSNYDPPLAFDDEFFDGVYAFSVFSHLPKEAEAAWLKELARITRPGAILLLSVVGERSLEIHHSRGTSLDVKWEDVKRDGFLFHANALHRENPQRWPGVTGDYGLAAHHPDYIASEWGKYFSGVKIVEAGAGGQDVVICTR